MCNIVGMEIKHHAYLYAILCKSILEEAGEEKGEELIRRFTRNYGIARGRRMRKHSPCGDMEGFFIAGEWQGKEGENLSSLSCEKDRTISTVTKCAWYDTWKEYGLLKEGSHYCRYIDRAICEGYGSDFSLDVAEAIGLGGECCIFIWNAPCDQTKIAKTRREFVQSFDFHCEELLNHAMAVLDEDLQAIVYAACRTKYAEEFGETGPFKEGLLTKRQKDLL